MFDTAPDLFSLFPDTLTFFFRDDLRPQKPYGLLGTGEEWDKEWEPGPSFAVHTAPELCHVDLNNDYTVTKPRCFFSLGVISTCTREKAGVLYTALFPSF